MKKFLTFILTVCMIIPCGILFTGCKDKGQVRVMNISLNPSIEFVLDKNDKVVTVNANNDEGNFVVAKANFKNLNVKDAVNLFIKTVQENGFIPEGNITSTADNLKIEISGDDAEKLFNSVKNSANEYLDKLDLSLDININFEQINKEDLQDLVDDCMRDLSDLEINGLSQKELIDLIKTSRIETSNLLSQELKEFYYQTRAEELLRAKFTEISNLITNNIFVSQDNKSQFETHLDTINQKIDLLKSEYVNAYMDESSEYQTAMQDYINAKKLLLEAQIENVDTMQLLQNFETAETILNNAKDNVSQFLEEFELAVESAIDNINIVFDVIASLLNQDRINEAIEAEKSNFKTAFYDEYKAYINNNYWLNLTPAT